MARHRRSLLHHPSTSMSAGKQLVHRNYRSVYSHRRRLEPPHSRPSSSTTYNRWSSSASVRLSRRHVHPKSVPYLPSDLWRQILIRVPAEPLLRFRCVCKEWRRIIDCPDFRQLHIHVQRQIGDAGNRLMIEGTDGSLYSLSLESLYRSKARITRKIEAVGIKHVENSNGHPGDDYILPRCFCDGLILFLDCYIDDCTTWVLWNPLLRDMLKLPPPPNEEFLETQRVGLGYDSSTNDYKAVKISILKKVMIAGISRTEVYVVQTSIYSLKSNKWHMIQDFPVSSNLRPSESGVCADGVLYWMMKGKCILALDLTTETYCELPLPLALSEGYGSLYESAGCLMLNRDKYNDMSTWLEAGVWILKDCASGNKVWTNLITLKRESTIGHYYEGLVCYMKRKEQVIIQCRDFDFLLIDLGANVGKKIKIHGIEETLLGRVFPESLVRLTGNAGKQPEMGCKDRFDMKKVQLKTAWRWKSLN